MQMNAAEINMSFIAVCLAMTNNVGTARGEDVGRIATELFQKVQGNRNDNGIASREDMANHCEAICKWFLELRGYEIRTKGE